VGRDHRQAGRDLPCVQVMHPDHACSERPRGVDSPGFRSWSVNLYLRHAWRVRAG
jgi:hypothetical protein